MALRPPSRRALLLGVGGAVLTTACGGRDGDNTGMRFPRVSYGSDQRQYGILGLPPRKQPLGTVVMIHGGGWLPTANLKGFGPMQTALTSLGYVTWNLEYRGTGVGGGFPGTFEDVAAGIDHLLDIDEEVSHLSPQVLTRSVAFLGQSAGAHLAVWAASRTARTPGGAPSVMPRTAISMGGPLNLALGAREGLAGGVVPKFMGGMPDQVPEHYALGDPIQLVPASCLVWALSGRQDTVVPREQALTYVAAARKAGGQSYFVSAEGNHNQLVLPSGQSWGYVRNILARTFGGGSG